MSGVSAGVGVDESGILADLATVTVIIPTFNQARFVADAIKSVLAQTHPADEIIVVDDGSVDNPAAAVAQFQKVSLIRQENRGLAGARNAGLRNCKTSHVVFLDSDDRLLPNALETGLVCARSWPECAFVYGGFRLISESGEIVGTDQFWPIEGDAHIELLRKNLLGPPGTGLFRRDCLLAVNGFDEKLRRAEDYDLYLRITQKYPIASHPDTVVEYRRHSQNMTNNRSAQLKAVLSVLDLHKARIPMNSEAHAALKEGQASRRIYYVSQMLKEASIRWGESRNVRVLVKDLSQAARWSPLFTMRTLLGALGRRTSKALPHPIVRWIGWIRGRPYSIPLGSVRFGDLRGLSPISRGFGFGRGKPVDRYYIETFLAQNVDNIRGRTLEVADNDYTLRFGGERVTHSDVLHAVPGNHKATLVGNLTTGLGIPNSVYDCMILTQTLLFIFDLKATVVQIRNALRPGGVALVTVPGISQISRYDMDRWGDYWRFTDASARRIFADVFGPENVTVVTYGNVLAACAFLQGIAAQELTKDELDQHDEDYQVTIGIRVIRSAEH